jgi:hypothetical protein
MTPPTIPEGMGLTDPSCKLTQSVSVGVSAWAYVCAPAVNNQRLVADPALPGFQLETTAADGTKKSHPAIVVFTKAAGAPVTAISEQVAKASPPDAGVACELFDESASFGELFPGIKAHIWIPAGEAGKRYQADENKTRSPCGKYGTMGFDMITFEELKGDPTKVVMLAWGQGNEAFIPTTVTAAPAP